LLVAFRRIRAKVPEIAARIAAAIADLAIFRDVLDLRSSLFAEARDAADASAIPLLRVRTRVLEAKVTLEIGAPSDAPTLLREAEAIAIEAGLLDAAADTQRSLGWALLATGRPDEAIAALDRAFARHRLTRDVRGQADALAARGLVRTLCGLGVE